MESCINICIFFFYSILSYVFLSAWTSNMSTERWYVEMPICANISFMVTSFPSYCKILNFWANIPMHVLLSYLHLDNFIRVRYHLFLDESKQMP
jgi:hypothetical protein